MKVLVTGGAGYVGSAALRHMLKQGIEAYAFDDLRTGHRGAVPDERLFVGNLRDETALVDALEKTGADAVMHFAAAALVGESTVNPDYYYENNLEGTRSLLNSMRAVGVKRLLFSSTCATYGDNPSLPLSENSEQMPSSPYANSKLAVEWMIKDFAKAYGMGFSLLRYFNAAGADNDGSHGQDHSPFTHLIPIVLEVALNQREHIKIFGTDYPTTDGTCIRDYVHVEDLAQAHVLAINATNSETREVFNIGTGVGNSVREVIETCKKVTGKDIKVIEDSRRAGDPSALVADPSKLKKQLGWVPRYQEIEKIVESAWRWHSKHPKGYND